MICLSLGCTLLAKAQIDNRAFENPVNLHDSMTPAISMAVYSNSFFKNNEYFDKISSGYTLFGTQLRTELAYVVNSHVRLQAGIYARKDFGNERFTSIAPVFSIKLQQNGYSLLMGTLEGHVAHRMAEPLYNYERLISDYLENGLQIKIDKPGIWADTWMNWEVQQYPASDFQEQLSVGHSSNTLLHRNENGWRIRLPLQFLITHRGGQLDADTTPIQTLANAGSGLLIDYINPDEHAFLQSIRSENYVFLYTDLSPAKQTSFQDGRGFLMNVEAKSKYHAGLSAGYWQGRKFLAPRGGFLYQSEASAYGTAGYTEANRDLFFVRLLYQRKLFDAIHIDLRFEPFYDLNAATLAYSYSCYLTYKSDLTLFNLKNGKRGVN